MGEAALSQDGDGVAKRTTVGVQVGFEVIAAPRTERGWASARGLDEGVAGSDRTNAKRGVEAVTVARHVTAASVANGEVDEVVEDAQRAGGAQAGLAGG